MKIPLLNRLRRQAHKDVALLQDELVEIIYSFFLDCKPVFHGGTAIWRCYAGNRFSEDLDFYAKPAGDFKQRFLAKAGERGLTVAKFKETQNLVFCKVSDGKAEVRLEINKQGKKGAAGEYEKADGGFLTIFVLSASELLKEKMLAYENRRFIRDVYDVYHLAQNAGVDDAALKKFVASLKPPLDEENLQVIVYSGVAPSFKQIKERLLA